MRTALRRLWKDESGQGLTEYALLVALVSLGLILLLGAYRGALGNLFRNSSNVLNTNGGPVMETP